MQIISLDAETYYRGPASDNTYTLKKMSTESYTRDPRFEVHGCAIKFAPEEEPRWYPRDELLTVFGQIDWENTIVLMQHAHFDGLILSHHYGIHPTGFIDTLNMGRAMLPPHQKKSLEVMAELFGLSPKRMPYNLYDGYHWHELDSYAQNLVARGCEHDVKLNWEIFKKLRPIYPEDEYELSDLTTKMFTRPLLKVDATLLQEIVEEEEHRKTKMMEELNVTSEQLRSAKQFVKLLEREGIEVPLKEGRSGLIPAIARTDQFMKDHIDDENPRIAALCRARLRIKSSHIQDKAEMLLDTASRGPVPVYLYYCGTHVTKWAGGDGTNFQNLKRGHRLRRALVAPDGWLFAAVDASQIELRVGCAVAGQWDVLEMLRTGADPYAQIASVFYRRPINKRDDPIERQTGKVLELQGLYGSGGPKIAGTLRNGDPAVHLSESEALDARDTYRSQRETVVRFWDHDCKNGLRLLGYGATGELGPCVIKNGCVWLPNGLPLIYDGIEWHQDPETKEQGWRYKSKYGWTRIWGSKLFENLVTALTRVIVGRAMARAADAGFPIVGMAHDEFWALVPDDGHAGEALQFMIGEMSREVDFLPGVPLSAEGKIGRCYSK